MAAFLFPEAKCVLIHIPKNAGASIRRGFFNGKYEGPVQGSIPEEWMQYFRFTFVRNPYDRLISAWKMFTQGMEESVWKYPEDGNPNLTLEQFLEIAMDESIPFDLPKRDKFKVKLRHHAIPQTHPFNCVDHANFIGRFESIERDFKEICDQLNLTGKLPHWNKTSRTDYRQYFNAATKQLASEYYAEDLSRFGYEF